MSEVAKFTGKTARFTWDAIQEGISFGIFYGKFYARHLAHLNQPEITDLAIKAFDEVKNISPSLPHIMLHWIGTTAEQERSKFIYHFCVSFKAAFEQEAG